MKTRDRILLGKILTEALDIAEFIQGKDRESFLASAMLKKAVVMSIINIGERINHLSDDIRKSNKEVSWKKISGLRNIAAHGYDTLRMEDIWDYACEDIPAFTLQIAKMLDS
jgi:uncharacterized protein with HEPN domain